MDIQYRIRRWRYGRKGSGAECSFDYLSVLGVFGVLCFMTHLLIVFSLSPTKPMSGTARGETQKNKREASSGNYTEFNDHSIQPRTMTAKMTVPSAAKTPMLRRQRAHCLSACACGRARQGARGRGRLFTKRLLARRNRHRLENVNFAQRTLQLRCTKLTPHEIDA